MNRCCLLTASLASPANATVTATFNVGLGAGCVSQVDFYDNGTFLATRTAAPFSFAWNSIPIGSHTLTAYALDSNGRASVSAPVTFTVHP